MIAENLPRLTSEGSKTGASSDVWALSKQKETKLAAGPSDVQQADAIGETLPTDGRMETEPGQLDGHSHNLRRETKSAVDLPVFDPRAAGEGLKAQAVTTANVVVKKEKPRKRVRDDVGSVGPDDTGGIKKKKKTKVLGVDARLSGNNGGESYGKLAGKSIGTVGLGHGQISRTESQRRDDGVVRTSDLNSAAARQPKVDMSSLNLEFPQLLSDLQESEHDMAKLQATRVAAALSQVEPGTGNADMALGKEAKDRREPSSSALKPLKPRLKPDDPTKAGRKRGPSDLQEQLNEKKVKKMNQINVLAVEKKAGISLKIPEGQQRKKKKSNTATASAASAKPNNKGAETVKKQEAAPPPPPLPFSPTALMLKFSPGTSLPLVAKLNASFVVFGPLVKDTTRVYWEYDSCRVIFEHKPHAQAALNYVSKNDLRLGPFRCHIRELDPTTLKPLSNIPGTPPPPQSRPSGGPPLVPGNGGQPRALPYQQQPAPTGQLKSIFRMPGHEGGGSAGGAAREPPQQVPIVLDDRDNRKISTGKVISTIGGQR